MGDSSAVRLKILNIWSFDFFSTSSNFFFGHRRDRLKVFSPRPSLKEPRGRGSYKNNQGCGLHNYILVLLLIFSSFLIREKYFDNKVSSCHKLNDAIVLGTGARRMEEALLIRSPGVPSEGK